MTFTFRTRSSHLLLSITFDDKFWRSHLEISHLRPQPAHNTSSRLTTCCPWARIWRVSRLQIWSGSPYRWSMCRSCVLVRCALLCRPQRPFESTLVLLCIYLPKSCLLKGEESSQLHSKSCSIASKATSDKIGAWIDRQTGRQTWSIEAGRQAGSRLRPLPSHFVEPRESCHPWSQTRALLHPQGKWVYHNVSSQGGWWGPAIGPASR